MAGFFAFGRRCDAPIVALRRLDDLRETVLLSLKTKNCRTFAAA